VSDKPPLLGRVDAVPRRRWQWLLPTLIAVAVVALVGSIVFRAVESDDTDPAKAALVAYLEALETNATTRAYGMLCASKTKPSLASFEKTVRREREDFGGVKRHRLDKLDKKSDTLVVATYTVQFETSYKWIAAAIVRQDGVWRPCGFKTLPRPSDTETPTTTR
jgi:hypothetical protein